jgi:hypothetical protein
VRLNRSPDPRSLTPRLVLGGDDFTRLHEWYGFAADAGPSEETIDSANMGKHFLDEIKETGSVLSGRNTVEQAGSLGR